MLDVLSRLASGASLAGSTCPGCGQPVESPGVVAVSLYCLEQGMEPPPDDLVEDLPDGAWYLCRACVRVGCWMPLDSDLDALDRLERADPLAPRDGLG